RQLPSAAGCEVFGRAYRFIIVAQHRRFSRLERGGAADVRCESPALAFQSVAQPLESCEQASARRGFSGALGGSGTTRKNAAPERVPRILTAQRRTGRAGP